jgi:hypothetical protein
MIKRYITYTWAWYWTAHITPLGIVGSWKDRHDLGEYFWMWKEEWC